VIVGGSGGWAVVRGKMEGVRCGNGGWTAARVGMEGVGAGGEGRAAVWVGTGGTEGGWWVICESKMRCACEAKGGEMDRAGTLVLSVGKGELLWEGDGANKLGKLPGRAEGVEARGEDEEPKRLRRCGGGWFVAVMECGRWASGGCERDICV
jgi:hypothetical protein